MSEMIQASKMDEFFKSSVEIKIELTAAQAEIARLREALEKIRNEDWGTDCCDIKNMIADEALSKINNVEK